MLKNLKVCLENEGFRWNHWTGRIDDRFKSVLN